MRLEEIKRGIAKHRIAPFEVARRLDVRKEDVDYIMRHPDRTVISKPNETITVMRTCEKIIREREGKTS